MIKGKEEDQSQEKMIKEEGRRRLFWQFGQFCPFMGRAGRHLGTNSNGSGGRCVKHTYVVPSLMPPTRLGPGNILSPTSATFGTPLLLQSTLPPLNTLIICLPVWNYVSNGASVRLKFHDLGNCQKSELPVPTYITLLYFPLNLVTSILYHHNV